MSESYEREASRNAEEGRRCKIATDAAVAMCGLVSEPALAMEIITAIDAGKIPNVTLNY